MALLVMIGFAAVYTVTINGDDSRLMWLAVASGAGLASGAAAMLARAWRNLPGMMDGWV
jgi:hypothetical protein